MRALLVALWRARAALALVEFAIAVPVLITLYLGAFVLSDEISCSRKVTVTARTVTDLTTRYASMTSTQLATIMASSAQVLAPYPVNKASVRVTELLVTGSTSAQVVWSQANAASGTATIPALTVGSTITPPTWPPPAPIWCWARFHTLTRPRSGLACKTP
jgi:Flp pilus assembly protein TadG